jgi:excisionase family DNA binding protein
MIHQNCMARNGYPGISGHVAATGDTPTPKLLTRRQAAAALNLSERTLWGLSKRGLIPVVRIGRLVRYDPRDLDRLIEAQKHAGIAADGGAALPDDNTDI